MKITIKEQREKIERKIKKSYSIAKKHLVKAHSVMTSAGKFKKFGHQLSPPIHIQPVLISAHPFLGLL